MTWNRLHNSAKVSLFSTYFVLDPECQKRWSATFFTMFRENLLDDAKFLEILYGGDRFRDIGRGGIKFRGILTFSS